jgi:hypothetical protein
MINTVGLLCKGNEEMVPFAYKLYQRYLQGDIKNFKADAARRKDEKNKKKQSDGSSGTDPLLDNHHDAHDRRQLKAANELHAFSNTFCRKEMADHDKDGKVSQSNIKVFFLGLWDCVNSVSVLEKEPPVPVPVTGTAEYVRHAVAVDEKRVKFKPALLAQDIRSCNHHHEDIKEVWFPGAHGDIGGGWPAQKEKKNRKDNDPDAQYEDDEVREPESTTWWEWIKNHLPWRSGKSQKPLVDSFQMSDIPLSWMIREIELIGEKHEEHALIFTDRLQTFKKKLQNRTKEALTGSIHNSLVFGTGTGIFTVLLWKFMGKFTTNHILSGLNGIDGVDGMYILSQPTLDHNTRRSLSNFPIIHDSLTDISSEYFPLITRYELGKDGWDKVRFPLNKGAARDIPPDAVFHESLIWRLQNDKDYRPANNCGGNADPCLKNNGVVTEFDIHQDEPHVTKNPYHRTYEFSDPDSVACK